MHICIHTCMHVYMYMHAYIHTCIHAYIYTLFNSCNMGMSDLPDMYAQSPRAAGPRAEGIYIRQITSAHVTTIM